jgi:hypothetical protein
MLEATNIGLTADAGKDENDCGQLSRGFPKAHSLLWDHCLSLSPSGTTKSVASDVWLSRQWRNPVATNTYQSRLRPNRKGVSLSERTFRAAQCRITLVSSAVRSRCRQWRATSAEKSGISV